MVQRIFGQSGKVGSRRSFEVVFCCLQDQTKSKNEDNNHDFGEPKLNYSQCRKPQGGRFALSIQNTSRTAKQKFRLWCRHQLKHPAARTWRWWVSEGSFSAFTLSRPQGTICPCSPPRDLGQTRELLIRNVPSRSGGLNWTGGTTHSKHMVWAIATCALCPQDWHAVLHHSLAALPDQSQKPVHPDKLKMANKVALDFPNQSLHTTQAAEA